MTSEIEKIQHLAQNGLWMHTKRIAKKILSGVYSLGDDELVSENATYLFWRAQTAGPNDKFSADELYELAEECEVMAVALAKIRIGLKI